jgi:hypothetical protein
MPRHSALYAILTTALLLASACSGGAALPVEAFNATTPDFIDSGGFSTSATTVELTLSANSAAGVVCIFITDNASGVEPPPPDTGASQWIPLAPAPHYSDARDYVFSGTYSFGTRVHIYVWFKDGDGNVSPAAHDSILYEDETPPENTTGSSFIVEMRRSSALLGLSARDSVGVTAYFVTDSDTASPPATPAPGAAGWTPVAETEDYAATVEHHFVSTYAPGQVVFLSVWFRDGRGNVSARAFQSASTMSVVFFEDFESGLGGWSADNGIWEVGPPSSGPGAAFEGMDVGATVLGGNYPDHTRSRLVSPPIDLPAAGLGEEIVLRFWHWFAIHGTDEGQVQVAEEVSPGVWTDWTTLATHVVASAVWTNTLVDLSAFAGKTVRIAFRLNQDQVFQGTNAGWYVDLVTVALRPTVTVDGANPFGEDFEGGLDEWWVDNGIWQVGAPGSGPGDAFGGTNAAATVLDGDYRDKTRSRLVSPSLELPQTAPGAKIELRFWHWFSIHGTDTAYVQVSEELSPGVWSAWSNQASFVSSSSVWTNTLVDLSSFAGKKVRVAFYLNQDQVFQGASAGWYIDDVTIEVKP